MLCYNRHHYLGSNLREVAADVPYERMIPGHLPEVLNKEKNIEKASYFY